MEPAIRMTGVTKSFGPTTAVEDLDLEVPRGGLHGFIGPNGAGKTTSIRMILSILFPDSGTVSVLDTPRPWTPRTGSATCPRSGACTGR